MYISQVKGLFFFQHAKYSETQYSVQKSGLKNRPFTEPPLVQALEVNGVFFLEHAKYSEMQYSVCEPGLKNLAFTGKYMW